MTGPYRYNAETMNERRLVFFCKGHERTASSRQRAFMVSARLRSLGFRSFVDPLASWDLNGVPLPERLLECVKLVYRALFLYRGDTLIFQRTVNDPCYFGAMWLVMLLRRRVFFDLDDALYLNSPRKLKLTGSLASGIIAGSREIARQMEYARRVIHIPTVLDHERYSAGQSGRNGRTFGWIGDAPAHFENLKLLGDALRSAPPEAPVELVVVGTLGDERIGALFKGIPNVRFIPVKEINWTDEELTIGTVGRFDFGLMPLNDTPWNRAKCAFKAIQYMACGVIPISSPVGEALGLIEHGVSGFFAGAAGDWTAGINKALRLDGETRGRMERCCRDTVSARYSLAAVCPRYTELL